MTSYILFRTSRWHLFHMMIIATREFALSTKITYMSIIIIIIIITRTGGVLHTECISPALSLPLRWEQAEEQLHRLRQWEQRGYYDDGSSQSCVEWWRKWSHRSPQSGQIRCCAPVSPSAPSPTYHESLRKQHVVISYQTFVINFVIKNKRIITRVNKKKRSTLF